MLARSPLRRFAAIFDLSPLPIAGHGPCQAQAP